MEKGDDETSPEKMRTGTTLTISVRVPEIRRDSILGTPHRNAGGARVQGCVQMKGAEAPFNLPSSLSSQACEPSAIEYLSLLQEILTA